jgi:hypothetical protein
MGFQVIKKPAMIKIDLTLQPSDLAGKLKRFWKISGEKIYLIEKNYDVSKGSPVYTSNGKYITRGWTEWTQGFLYGSMILQYDATGENEFLEMGRRKTIELMAPHISHMGVHDHGFNNVSTYGNLLRLMKEGKIAFNEWEKDFYSLALKISGAVQARRWTIIKGGGFIYSFNGPHSLFVDTIRSCRSLILSHCLGHVLQSEGDQQISLLERAVEHMKATASYSIFYCEGRDAYDVLGRTAHESIFNVNDGNFRCQIPSRGTQRLPPGQEAWHGPLRFMKKKNGLIPLKMKISPAECTEGYFAVYDKAARAVCDFYIDNCPTDGVPYWDTGAPDLNKLGDYLNKPADPFNDFEPVDSSAAPIAAQGLLRLGKHLQQNGKRESGDRYWQAGLTILNTIFDEPYLSWSMHQGLLLYSFTIGQTDGIIFRPEKNPHDESVCISCPEAAFIFNE